MGYRVNEAISIAKNFSSYFDSITNTIKNVSGKGGNIYAPKEISSSLVSKIKSLANEKIISKSGYQKILSKFGIKSHDFRFSYASNLFSKCLNINMSYSDSLSFTSMNLGHKRKAMTQYYLKRI